MKQLALAALILLSVPLHADTPKPTIRIYCNAGGQGVALIEKKGVQYAMRILFCSKPLPI